MKNTFVTRVVNEIAPLLVVAALFGLMTGCEHKATSGAELKLDEAPKVSGETITFAASSPALKNIVTAKVEAPRDRQLNVPGRLVWDEDRTVRVFTPFAGRVSRVVANVGDRVTKGQVLAELQSPDFAVAQADARKAQSTLLVTRASLARVKELAANGIAAGKDLLQAEADFANADAEANRAQARLKLYGNRQDVDQRFALVSPIAGTVVERNINPGQELRPDQPGAPQFVVTDPGKLWVQLDAAESDLSFLKPGTPILVMSGQYPDDTFAGELKQIADYIDPVSRTLKLRGNVANSDRRLKAEMFITARITMPKIDYPVVPEKAVFLDGIRRYVFVKTNSEQFSRRGVKIGAEGGALVPALSGVKEGEEVVTAGNLFLQQMVAAARGGRDTLESVAPSIKPSGNYAAKKETNDAPKPLKGALSESNGAAEAATIKTK